MKFAFASCILFFLSFFGRSQSVELIPAVNNMQTFSGTFEIDKNTVICIDSNNTMLNEANYLKKLIEEHSNFEIRIVNYSTQNYIQIFTNEGYLDKDDEAYTMNVSKEGIVLEAASSEAAMRGIQTLRQLFPLEFHGNEIHDAWPIQFLELADYPAFEHRGFLLDVCRHFFDKEVVKEYIDLLAFYRMNVLHLHLTEDQGWRFASDKYPLLNTISSVRTELNGEKYGGIFTKEELREIVNYAQERHITVIPEIEMPGHSQAVLAAYPNLSCTGDSVEVANDWGVFKEIYCAGNEETFEFLENILLEVIEIFPSKYIHIGGDEAPKSRWEECAKCQKRIKEKGLEDEHELQSYFIQRIERFLEKHDRVIIGWDEILEGGLSANSTVQSWRGFDGGIQAANENHDVIMSPTSHCYLDYGLSSIDLERIYKFNPVPKELNSNKNKYIIGGECNMWTEHVPDRKTLDNRVFPRMIAFAEALWTAPAESQYPYFYNRLQSHYPVLDLKNIQYGQEMIPVSFSDTTINDENHLKLNFPTKDFSCKYKWIYENNSSDYINYSEPLRIDKTGKLRVQPLKNDENYGETIEQEFVVHQAINAEVNYLTDINKWYTAGGDDGLVNGKVGSMNFRDGNWQGFWGEDLKIELELDEVVKPESIQLNFYHYANSWIIHPQEIIVETSKNGKKWKTQELSLESPDYSNLKKIVSSELKLNKKIKFIKVTCLNPGLMPKDHDAAGEPTWIFIDEIIVK